MNKQHNRQPKKIRLIKTLLALPFSLSLVAQAVAQEQTAARDENAAEAFSGIEVIQVSAEKRVSTLQETAIAISAFNAEVLERQSIEEASDIQFAIPNALFTDRGAFNIRGVGNNARSATAESGAGVHINGVYLTAPAGTNEYYDLQSIEVLRGPQGTLYGRNTTAGVVNIITHRPTDEFEGNATVELGNFDSFRAVGAVNIPITEDIRQRFAFNVVDRSGFTENIKDGSNIDGRSQFSVRSTTAFDINDNWNGMLFAEYYDEDSNRSNRRGVRCISDPVLGCSSTELGFEFVDSDYADGNLKNFLALAGIPVDFFIREDFYNTNADGTPRINPSDPRKVNIDNEPIFKAEDLLVSLELNYETDTGIYTSVTSWHDRKGSGQRDFDNANGEDAFNVEVAYAFNDDIFLNRTRDFEPVQLSTVKSEQLSQEFRFVSELDANLNYTAGVYWLNYKTNSRVATYFPYLSIIARASGLPVEFHDFDTRSPDVETKSWALFGEVYYDMSDDLKLTVGLRYSDEYKSQKTQTVTPLSFLDPTFDPTAFEELDESWQEVTGKIGLSYQLDTDLTDQTLLFGTLSRGYKAGGLNPGGASKQAYDAEYIHSLELGVKNTLFNRKLQANVTAFYYDYEGLQLGALETGGTGAAITDNTDAEVSGIEFEFVAAPIDGLYLTLNYSILNSEITGEFPTPDSSLPSNTGPVDIRGNSLAYAPDSSLQFGIEYRHGILTDKELVWRAQSYWQDDYFARVYNTTNDEIDSWNQTDVSVSLQDIDKKWKLEWFVKNLENSASITGLTVENTLAGRFRLPAVLDPIQYGARIQFNF